MKSLKEGLLRNQIPTAVELLQRNPTLLSPCYYSNLIISLLLPSCFVPAKCLYISSLLAPYYACTLVPYYVPLLHVEIN